MKCLFLERTSETGAYKFVIVTSYTSNLFGRSFEFSKEYWKIIECLLSQIKTYHYKGMTIPPVSPPTLVIINYFNGTQWERYFALNPKLALGNKYRNKGFKLPPQQYMQQMVMNFLFIFIDDNIPENSKLFHWEFY